MEKVGIISDDACDIPQELINKHQIAIAPVKFTWPEIEGLPGENTFQKMRELEKRGITSFGKTSQPAVNDFLEKFEYQLSRFESVICVTITSKLSGTYNSAIQAKNYLKPEDQKRLFIVDSLSVSGGEALIIFKAIDPASSGKKIEEIVKDLENLVPQCHCSVILENPKWLEKSGRISHFVATVINGLEKAGIRPVMSMKNGTLSPTGLKTDAKDIPTALYRQFENDTKELIKTGKKIKVVITHGDDPAGAQRLKELVEKISLNINVVFINIINNVVGVVAGPNAITLSWCEM
jgi:DegV family protein with EDD domain